MNDRTKAKLKLKLKRKGRGFGEGKNRLSMHFDLLYQTVHRKENQPWKATTPLNWLYTPECQEIQRLKSHKPTLVTKYLHRYHYLEAQKL